MNLSIIIPFYKKLDVFRRVFPLNHPYVSNSDIEIVLCLDDDSELEGLLDFVGRFQDVKWKVIVCHERHDWRTPSKAINVGIRRASGQYILVVSPESLFVNNLPRHMLKYVKLLPDAAICGRLIRYQIEEFFKCEDAHEAMFLDHVRGGKESHYYASILVSREKAIEVGGYDECLVRWGGDDDNFRSRLALAGVRIFKTRNITVLHLDAVPERPKIIRTQEEMDYFLRPKEKTCRKCYDRWGYAFDHVVMDWQTRVGYVA